MALEDGQLHPLLTGGVVSSVVLELRAAGPESFTEQRRARSQHRWPISLLPADPARRGIVFGSLTRDAGRHPTDPNIPSPLVSVVAVNEDYIKDTPLRDAIRNQHEQRQGGWFGDRAEVGSLLRNG
ncbi:hypothetical protein [Streptomyces glaucescens]|uniref:hypothetical protein n=1 Tax=Streptomyces glaucescens TaxID=1907 RepID=UPI001FCBAF15|nr:hypothetical protein [Streptomyces glaucescens]